MENNVQAVTDFVPMKANFTLKEACDLKGLCYKTAVNRVRLQPGSGKADGYIGGRKVFARATVLAWLYQYDNVS
jgi:hypothetical protein